MPAGRYPRCADTLCRERAAKLRRHRCWSSASAPGSKTQAFASTETCLGASPSRRQLARLHDPRSADTEWIPRRSHHSTETRFGGASRARCDDNSYVCCRDPRGAHTKSRALAPRRSHSRHRNVVWGRGVTFRLRRNESTSNLHRDASELLVGRCGTSSAGCLGPRRPRAVTALSASMARAAPYIAEVRSAKAGSYAES